MQYRGEYGSVSVEGGMKYRRLVVDGMVITEEKVSVLS